MDGDCLRTDNNPAAEESTCFPEEVSILGSTVFPISILCYKSFFAMHPQANSLGQAAVSNLLTQFIELTPLHEQLVLQTRSILKESTKNSLVNIRR